MPSNIYIHQIFYNEETKAQLDPGYIPLDNTANERPDWYEFWPMLKWLQSNPMNDNDWYGFLSPKFFRKTGFTSADVFHVIEQFKEEANIATFSVSWDQAAYFKNVFEQGELWHPGITEVTQQFLNDIGDTTDLQKMVNYSYTSVLSNFIIAKPKFWKEWLSLAEKFFAYAESKGVLKDRTTTYGSNTNQAPIKTFIQERFASLILSRGGFITIPVDMSQHIPMYERLFKNTEENRKRLGVCDFLKNEYLKTGDALLIEMHQKIRSNAILS